MKWYYTWRIKRVRAKISALEQETRARLAEDYTAHSRLRVLMRLADGLEQRLAKSNRAPAASGTPAAGVLPTSAVSEG